MKTRVKNIAFLVLALCLFMFLYGCEMMAKRPPAEVYNPVFDWTPPNTAKTGAAEVVFILVQPQYQHKQGVLTWTRNPVFSSFSKSLSLDTRELLTARGYTARGPFQAFDEIPFPDKKGSDLVLEPTIEIRLNNRITTSQKNFIIGWDIGGVTFVSYLINFTVRESLTRELMWSKKVEFAGKDLPWGYTGIAMNSAQQIEFNARQGDIPDDSVGNQVARYIEETYVEALSKAWTYLDPEEMKLIKKQAKVLREKQIGKE